MAHIFLPDGCPGIRGPMMLRPETAKPMNELANVLLRGPGTLPLADRELIAAYVSALNGCGYCHTIHGAIAAHYLNGDEQLVACVKDDFESAEINDKLKSLLNIAGKVAHSGKEVQPADISRARADGATDLEIHDTVLIASMFCMCNRYVDGLGTFAPDDPAFYRSRAAVIASEGYSVSAPAAEAVSR